MKKNNAVEFSPSELKNQKLKLKQVKKLDKIVVALQYTRIIVFL